MLFKGLINPIYFSLKKLLNINLFNNQLLFCKIVLKLKTNLKLKK